MQIQLRPIKRKDVEFLYACRQEISSQMHNPLENLSLNELRRRYAQVGHDLRDRLFTDYRWVATVNETLIGYSSIKGIHWRMGFGDLGYGVAECYQGRGLGTALVRALIDMIFETSDLRRLTAHVSTANTASWRLLERLGFQREGMLREHFLIQGQPRDEYVYGLLRREWRAPESMGGSHGKS